MKWIGITILALSLLALGQIRVTFWKHRLACTQGITMLLRHIREQIRRFSMPLDEIYMSFHETIDGGKFDRLLKTEGFEKALSKTSVSLDLPGGVLPCLKSLAGKLGKSDAEEQIDCCEQALSVMEECLNEENKRYPERVKVCRVVSAAAALTAVILFL